MDESIQLPLELAFVRLHHGWIDQRPFEYEEELSEVHIICRGRASGFRWEEIGVAARRRQTGRLGYEPKCEGDFFPPVFFALAFRRSLQLFRRSQEFPSFQKCDKEIKEVGGGILRPASRVPQLLTIPLAFLNYFLCDKKVLGSGALLDSPS